jgi:hypothetical protein
MRNILIFICLCICTLVFAGTPKKPVIHMTTSAGEITYYSSSFDDPSKFDFKVLSWTAYLKKYQYGWRIVEGKWVRETLRPDKSSAPVTRVFIPPSWRNGGGGAIIVNNKTLSAPPSKK